jgi:hypothetical protein
VLTLPESARVQNQPPEPHRVRFSLSDRQDRQDLAQATISALVWAEQPPI